MKQNQQVKDYLRTVRKWDAWMISSSADDIMRLFKEAKGKLSLFRHYMDNECYSGQEANELFRILSK